MPQPRLHRRLTAAPAAVLACALALAALPLGGCSRDAGRPGRVDATGSVIAEEVVIPVPTLAVPVPDVEVGFPPAAGVGAAGGSGSAGSGGGAAPGAGRSAASTVTAVTSLGTFSRVTSVAVEPGDRVKAGDVVAQLDPTLLQAAVASAESAAKQARANRDLLESSLDTVESNRSDLASMRAKLVRTIADLERTRAQLRSQLAAARTALARLEALGAGGPLPPAGSVPPGGLPNPAQLRAGIAKMTAGLAKLDAGLAKARAGLRKLDSARATLADARTTLRSTRGLAAAAVDLSDVAVEIAKARLGEATVRAPQDGFVLEAARAGDVLAPGAPLATLRPVRASRVQLWLAAEELGGVSAGDAASVRIDSRPGEAFSARVSLVGSEADFPPTSLATRIIHLTRAVPVQVTLDSDVTLPPGTPADVTISTR